jgi:catechol 2,3-dioxygenase-like lactoylglutathione lyase family enzyme
MIDHLGLVVSDYERSKDFYLHALKPLGIAIIMEVTGEQTGREAATGFGKGQKPFFWIGAGVESKSEVHIAFTADDRKTVDEFYAAATAAGGRDNGKPGLRPHYHPNYYGAFVFDPDGNNIEAVCHAPA